MGNRAQRKRERNRAEFVSIFFRPLRGLPNTVPSFLPDRRFGADHLPRGAQWSEWKIFAPAADSNLSVQLQFRAGIERSNDEWTSNFYGEKCV